MLVQQGSRPRVLRWFHAGPMLFGDWGTSRLYVLGLAFAFMGRASFWFMLAMSVLLVALGWAYEVICRHFPDGGGVYSAARRRSHLLGMIGGLLLCADYVVTAALSALDAFHYLGLPHPALWAAAGIALIGVVNFFGPKKAGTLALVVALVTIALTLVIAAFAIPSLGAVQIERPHGTPLHWWSSFTSIILAISGVEAIANMTGIMVAPVEKTARRSIWPVVAEIVVLNLILTAAMQAIPLEVLGGGSAENAQTAHRDDMLKLLASHYVGATFAGVASLAFAGLLLSAVNTAITDLVSIQFMMSRDQELPDAFRAPNSWGMPVVGLMVGTVIPAATVLLVPDVEHLSHLYAIGVVGAITINLATCGTNRELDLKRYERWGMLGLAALMIAVWITIAYEKPSGLVFALSITAAGLSARYVHRNWQTIGRTVAGRILNVVGQVETAPAAVLVSAAAASQTLPAATRPRILVSTRGNPKLLKFAMDEAKAKGSELLILYVRHIAVQTMGSSSDAADVSADGEATALFDRVRADAEKAGVPAQCLYALSYDIGETVLDMAATHGVSTVILGATQRGGLWRAMKGDVIQQVATYLPEQITLLIHA